jgi:hypothetical protein
MSGADNEHSQVQDRVRSRYIGVGKEGFMEWGGSKGGVGRWDEAEREYIKVVALIKIFCAEEY